MGNGAERQISRRSVIFGSLGLALLAACGGNDNTASETPTESTGVRTETPGTPTPPPESPTPKSTLEPPTVAPTATAEVKQEVPCQILPTEYCSGADLIEFTYQGKKYTYVGLHLPAGIGLQSPMHGQVAKAEIAQPAPYRGLLVSIIDPENPASGSFGLVGDMTFPNMLSTNVEPGDTFGQTGNTGIENFGNYNLLIGASDTDLLRNLFPSAFSKPPKEVAYEGSIAPTYTDIYSDNPPK